MSTNVDCKETPILVGSIEYLSTSGKVRETEDFTSAEKMIATAKDELYYGVPLSLVVYQYGPQKQHMAMGWLEDLDTLPCGLRYAQARDHNLPPKLFTAPKQKQPAPNRDRPKKERER